MWPDHLLARSRLVRNIIGVMLEIFFMYGEDVEWQLRARQGGYRLVYCPHSKVWHKENASSGYKSPFVEYYGTRNSIWIVRRYYLWRLPVAVFFHLFRAGCRILTDKWQQAAAVLRGIFSGVTANSVL